MNNIKTSPTERWRTAIDEFYIFLSLVDDSNTSGKTAPSGETSELPLILLDFTCVRSLYADENFELIYILPFVFLSVNVCEENNFSANVILRFHLFLVFLYAVIFVAIKRLKVAFERLWEDRKITRTKPLPGRIK